MLLKHGDVVADPWIAVDDDAALPTDSPVVVSLPRLLNETASLLARSAALGVRLRNSEPVNAIGPYLHRLTLVTLDFPKFTDGRAYTQARVLRERLHYTGELRATGQVLLDQLMFMQRCGFDSFAIDRTDAKAAWAATQEHFTAFYQPAGDGRTPIPWLRRRLAQTARA